MQELNIVLVSAGDTQPEKRTALQLIGELNASYRGRLELLPGFSAQGTPHVVAALVWNEADDALEQALASAAATEMLLFTKTTAATVDLTDRAEVMRRLQARARLDELLAATRTFRAIPFDDGDFGDHFEREVRRIADRQLGISSEPVNLRPQLERTYLSRPRLLRSLPDTPGHIVRLEAPYGSGKSVLAAQWAEALEAEGWRVLWLARDPNDADLRPLLATALGVTADTPDALLRERLWQTPTLLVAEDLDGDEDLGLLLDDPEGLILLAARAPLSDEKLLALAQAGRVTHLDAQDLAFTLAEAEQLVGDSAAVAELHAATLGWALPLHIAGLTGSAADPNSLLAGIQASAGDTAWRELLFLAALPYLPRSSANPDTQELVAQGFVQELETSYRLHPLIAEIALDTHRDEIGDIVARHAERLPLLLQGEAFERLADYEHLVKVLEAVEAELWRQGPGRLVRWDRAIRGMMSPKRHWAVGTAHQRLSDFRAAIPRLFAALEAPELDPDERLGIMRELCVPLGIEDVAAGRALIERAEPLLDVASPEIAGRFLGNAAIIHAHAQEPAQAITLAERALGYLPERSSHRIAIEVNLGLFRFDSYGDFDHRLDVQLATLDAVRSVYPVQAIGQCRDIGMLYWWLGQREKARHYLELALEGEAVNPVIGLEARAALAFLDGDRSTVTDLGRTARLLGDTHVADMVSRYEILQLLEVGEVEQAKRSYEQSPKRIFASCAYAQVLAAQGSAREAAVTLLDRFATPERIQHLYLTATRYLITREAASLAAFLEVTTAGPRLLPGFIPLELLPDDPALARNYPIAEVLRSGRKTAIAAREADIPDLQLTLLGALEVRLLGASLEPADRQKQILVLTLLGKTRDEVAEIMWPDTDPRKQRNNLHVQLNALRKVIEPWGVSTYLFEEGLERTSSDYGELITALTMRDADAVHALFREPFAPGIDLAPVAVERERLREAVVTLLFEASEQAPATDAATYLDRVLELEPLHEEALQRLLRQLVRRGRRREARQRFDRFARRLEEELDLEPLAETREILGS